MLVCLAYSVVSLPKGFITQNIFEQNKHGRNGVGNDLLHWCRHLLVPFFHDMSDIPTPPLHFIEIIFPLVKVIRKKKQGNLSEQLGTLSVCIY